MNLKIKTFCIGIICILIPTLTFSQNVFDLNNDIKSMYSYEYTTVRHILKSLLENEFDQVFSKTDKSEKEKTAYIKQYNEMRDKLIYSGIPDDSCITVTYNNKVIKDVVYGGDIKLKNVIFQVFIKDSEIKDFDNVLTFEFYTDKETDFEFKTHNYKLNKLYLTPASWYEGRANMIDAFKNLDLDSIMNWNKNNLR